MAVLNTTSPVVEPGLPMSRPAKLSPLSSSNSAFFITYQPLSDSPGSALYAMLPPSIVSITRPFSLIPA